MDRKEKFQRISFRQKPDSWSMANLRLSDQIMDFRSSNQLSSRKVANQLTDFYSRHQLKHQLKLIKKKKTNYKKFIKSAWSAICTIGMMYQIIVTTLDYLQYHVISEVSIKLDYEFDVPALGLCFNPVAFRTDGICSRNVSYGEMKKCYRNEIESKMTLKDIMADLSSDLVSRVKNENEIFEIDTFYKSKACLDINLKVSKVNLSTITKGLAESRHIFMVEVNLTGTAVKDFSVHLHNPSVAPRGIYIKTLGLLFGNTIRNGYQIGYQRIITHRLPRPFKDGCINYGKDSSFDSHPACIDHCVAKNIRRKFGQLRHPYSLFRSTSFQKEIYFMNVSHINYSNFHDNCELICPKNCTTISYNLMTVDSEIYLDDQLTIVVDYLEPNIDITYRPRLTLEEYLIYIGSIFSLWFGWCFHATPIHSIESIGLIIKRKK